MRYIAVIKVKETGCYECEEWIVYESITDWTEVSEEDFNILLKASRKSFEWGSKIPSFKILERPLPEDVNSYILNTVADYNALIKKEENKAAEAKRKKEAAKKLKEANAKKKAEQSKEAKIAALKKELEELAKL